MKRYVLRKSKTWLWGNLESRYVDFPDFLGPQKKAKGGIKRIYVYLLNGIVKNDLLSGKLLHQIDYSIH